MQQSTEAVPATLPLLPLKDIVVFPQMILPVFVSEDVCLRAIEAALAKDKLLFLSAFANQKPAEFLNFGEESKINLEELKSSLPSPYDVYDTGTVAMVMRTRKLPDGRTKVLIQGMYRAQATALISQDGYPVVKMAACPDIESTNATEKNLRSGVLTVESVAEEALIRTAKISLEKLVSIGKNVSPDILVLLEEMNDAGKIADLIVSNLNLRIVDAQLVLGTFQKLQRLKRVVQLLAKEIDIAFAQKKLLGSGINPSVLVDASKINLNQVHQISNPSQSSLGGNTTANGFGHSQQSGQSQKSAQQSSSNLNDHAKASREQFLREQMRAIKMELGDLDGKEEMDELRDRIEKAIMTPEAKTESLKQLKRLERMNQESSEATITRTYIECLCDLPWTQLSETEPNMMSCRKVLDEDHFGLEKIKDRMLEYIAVRKLNPTLRGPVLCFVGPPGVGKTSLGRSIAKSLGRKFVRIALGGVRDEAEIRGHRRTYVGAQPGRLMQAIKTCGYRNPVVMLDEIDKLASDYKGDPASALLEVLDPEQNHAFSDHYVAVPFDLSQVIFLANANRLDTIPAPLRDRLEIIEVSGYSEEEKLEIAKKYIVPKTLQQNGLDSRLVSIQDNSLQLVINRYTRESGLRSLEKQVAMISRKIARNIAENDEQGIERKAVKVSPKICKDLLGEERYFSDEHDVTVRKVGVATGLAYTSTGGEVLELEVNLTPGKGALLLTGQLGDVMKESVHAALSYIKSRHNDFDIAESKFTTCDLHLHIPAGAVPKDGPSAGVTIATALVSAFSGRSLRQDVAMTGEISLQGKVLPVGGLREKILAALRVGVKTVFVPSKNKGAIAELPVSLKKRIDIRFAEKLDDILEVALGVSENVAATAENKTRHQAANSGAEKKKLHLERRNQKRADKTQGSGQEKAANPVSNDGGYAAKSR